MILVGVFFILRLSHNMVLANDSNNLNNNFHFINFFKCLLTICLWLLVLECEVINKHIICINGWLLALEAHAPAAHGLPYAVGGYCLKIISGILALNTASGMYLLIKKGR